MPDSDSTVENIKGVADNNGPYKPSDSTEDDIPPAGENHPDSDKNASADFMPVEADDSGDPEDQTDVDIPDDLLAEADKDGK